MAEIRKVEPVKLFAGLVVAKEDTVSDVERLLKKQLGEIDHTTELIPFNFTDYYTPEMGMNLLRKWVGFKKLVSPDMLAKIKLKTNQIEKKFSLSGCRTVNIDPGYLAFSKVVLASTKDFSHRVYVSKGIFEEITLQFKQNAFVSLPWTYPDYKSETALNFFKDMRSAYYRQIGDL